MAAAGITGAALLLVGVTAGLRGVEQLAGVILILAGLIDVFLTVLYARITTGIIARTVTRGVWQFFRWASAHVGPYRELALAFCGPSALLSLVGVWSLVLTLGAALVIHPELGTGIQAPGGGTAKDFITALYAGGSSVSIVHGSDLSPKVTAMFYFYMFDSLVGTAVLSLTLAYLMQVYSALLKRNSLGLQLHLLSSETGDAARLIAGLGSKGQFAQGFNVFAGLAAELASIQETHHFFPVLFFFRFRDARYAVSRIALIAFETVTLIETGLDPQYDWLKRSGAIQEFWRAAMLLITTLETAYLGGPPAVEEQLSEKTCAQWRCRYLGAIQVLRDAGIATAPDEEAGAKAYASMRKRWDALVVALAPALGFGMDEVDPFGYPSASLPAAAPSLIGPDGASVGAECGRPSHA
jgi:hypothetical protein